ncbi:MAG: PKD domain-containing protein [Acidobacteria bacterium]|nr:PKD domain-containing protein [Acidobacteriota bacterium]
MSTFLRRSSVAVAAALLAGACTVHKSETPALTGPSEYGLSVRVTAVPDSINQDGASQSAIVASVYDASGQPKAGASLRADISVGGVIQDFGQLSAKTLVTGSDGKASTIYTAPAAVSGAGATSVSILVTPIGTDYQAASSQAVAIRLSPPGVILPVTGAPLAKFAFAPAAPNAKSPVTFDGTTSCGSTDTTSACTTTSKVVTYAWDFGDGTTATGAVVSHAFALQQTYSVALTVTNDKGATATSRQNVVTAAGLLPTANFTFSPAAPNVGDTVYFDGSLSTPGAGHTIASYAWTSGDGTVGTGIAPSYKFLKPGNFTVSLKVTDEAGQSAITSKQVAIASSATALPTATFTFSPTGPGVNQNVFFNASQSVAGAGHTLAGYAWDFGDGNSASGVTATHAYARSGTFNVILVVTDEAGQKASSSPVAVTVANTSSQIVAAFVFSPTDPAVGQTVNFDSTPSSTSPGFSITGYAWDFGDGTTCGNTGSLAACAGSNAKPTHAYGGAAHTWVVRLTVTDNNNSQSATTTVNVTTK